MKSIGYIRQSKERKDRNSISPETQLEKIKQFSKLQDSELVETFQDIDISGFRVHYSKRTGLMDMLQFIKDNNISKLYVYALSRLSRRIKDFIEITDILEEYGVSVVSVTEMIDMSTPQGRLFRNILISFNEYYSDSLSTTILDNHKKNVQLKKWNGGNAPYGYNWDKTRFIPNNNHTHLIYIKEKAIEGWGVKKISNSLNQRKIQGPNGGKWYSQTVKYILSNPFYRGYLHYDGEVYESDLAVTFITDDDWDIINANLSRYEGIGPRGKVSPHLLTGILYCGECGERFEIRYNGSTKARRYICSGRQHNQGGKCTSNLIDSDSLETRIIEHLQIITESTYFDDIISHYTNMSKPNENTLKTEIKRLEVELSKIVQAQTELYDDTFVNRLISKDRFYEMDKHFNKQREQLESEIKGLYKNIEVNDTSFVFDYKEELSNFIAVFDKLTSDEKRIAIHSLIENITVYDDYVKVKLPFGDKKIKSTSIKRGTMFF